jgi:branched-chain amino acid aminotransferase
MFGHEDVWRAIDTLAERHGLTASGLARRAGLDATSFNLSKRFNPDGKPRWPGTEALAKVLTATGGTLEQFGALVGAADADTDAGPDPVHHIATPTSDNAVTWIEGEWIAGNPPILGPMSHAVWMASVVFDGARAFRRLAPDLDLHCRRAVQSALAMGLVPPVTAEQIEAVAWQGIERFPPDAELYIRPLMYSEEGFVVAVPNSTKFILSVFEAPLPDNTGIEVCVSSFRRPLPETAPTDAKTACLYPNVARAMREARDRGFGTALILDPYGDVAELAVANLFMVRDGVVSTPALNRTFLPGITRARVMQLLRDDGFTVEERTIGVPELMQADEIFATGNYTKIQSVLRVEDRQLQLGPVAARAGELYFAFAEREGARHT